ncbi:MAG: hypothetical protein JNL58_25030 [Planctomyces sp.]|nr:hypothetical protein [Planctomyces sp.]
MKPISCNLIRSTAAVCVLMVSGFISAQEGRVRITDKAPSSGEQSGVVRLSDRAMPSIQQASFTHGGPACGDAGCVPGCAVPQDCWQTPGCMAPVTCCPPTQMCCDPCMAGCDPCMTGCDPCSYNGACYGMAGACCNNGHGHGGNCFSGNCHNGNCHNGNCHGNYCDGYNDRMNCLFAGSQCSGSGCPGHDWWRGQSLSFREKNSRLANHLFGWMVPSGCCGQGCPPVGKYHITYADQPNYFDQRDGQLYGAQGYGMPMTVPLAPHVRQQYNYGWGVPSSRLTHISNYNPQTSPQPLYHQTW